MPPYRVIFFGTPLFACEALKGLISDPRFEPALVVAQPDRPAGRGNRLCAPPVKEMAIDASIPVLQPDDIRKREKDFLDNLSSFGPFDAGVVCAFGQILPQSVLNFPKHGCINIHASLLPRWRGAAPIQRAILAGDVLTGISLMKMEAGLDTGPVYSTATIAIEQEDDYLSLHDRLARLGAGLLVKDLPDIISENLIPVPQDENPVTYAKRVTKKEALIDWSSSSREIARQIRAFNPSPGAYTYLNGKRFKIYKAVSKEQAFETTGQRPGEVVCCEQPVLEILCGRGIISPTEVQIEGKRKMVIADFIKGQQIETGMVLGTDP